MRSGSIGRQALSLALALVLVVALATASDAPKKPSVKKQLEYKISTGGGASLDKDGMPQPGLAAFSTGQDMLTGDAKTMYLFNIYDYDVAKSPKMLAGESAKEPSETLVDRVHHSYDDYYREQIYHWPHYMFLVPRTICSSAASATSYNSATSMSNSWGFSFDISIPGIGSLSAGYSRAESVTESSSNGLTESKAQCTTLKMGLHDISKLVPSRPLQAFWGRMGLTTCAPDSPNKTPPCVRYDDPGGEEAPEEAAKKLDESAVTNEPKDKKPADEWDVADEMIPEDEGGISSLPRSSHGSLHSRTRSDSTLSKVGEKEMELDEIRRDRSDAVWSRNDAEALSSVASESSSSVTTCATKTFAEDIISKTCKTNMDLTYGRNSPDKCTGFKDSLERMFRTLAGGSSTESLAKLAGKFLKFAAHWDTIDKKDFSRMLCEGAADRVLCQEVVIELIAATQDCIAKTDGIAPAEIGTSVPVRLMYSKEECAFDSIHILTNTTACPAADQLEASWCPWLSGVFAQRYSMDEVKAEKNATKIILDSLSEDSGPTTDDAVEDSAADSISNGAVAYAHKITLDIPSLAWQNENVEVKAAATEMCSEILDLYYTLNTSVLNLCTTWISNFLNEFRKCYRTKTGPTLMDLTKRPLTFTTPSGKDSFFSHDQPNDIGLLEKTYFSDEEIEDGWKETSCLFCSEVPPWQTAITEKLPKQENWFKSRLERRNSVETSRAFILLKLRFTGDMSPSFKDWEITRQKKLRDVKGLFKFSDNDELPYFQGIANFVRSYTSRQEELRPSRERESGPDSFVGSCWHEHVYKGLADAKSPSSLAGYCMNTMFMGRMYTWSDLIVRPWMLPYEDKLPNPKFTSFFGLKSNDIKYENIFPKVIEYINKPDSAKWYSDACDFMTEDDAICKHMVQLKQKSKDVQDAGLVSSVRKVCVANLKAFEGCIKTKLDTYVASTLDMPQDIRVYVGEKARIAHGHSRRNSRFFFGRQNKSFMQSVVTPAEIFPRFFKIFGTHYIKEAEMGGELSLYQSTSSYTKATSCETAGGFGVKGEFMTAKAGVSVDVAVSESESKTESETNSEIVVIGGSPEGMGGDVDAEQSWADWAKEVDLASAPINPKMRSICDWLFTLTNAEQTEFRFSQINDSEEFRAEMMGRVRSLCEYQMTEYFDGGSEKAASNGGSYDVYISTSRSSQAAETFEGEVTLSMWGMGVDSLRRRYSGNAELDRAMFSSVHGYPIPNFFTAGTSQVDAVQVPRFRPGQTVHIRMDKVTNLGFMTMLELKALDASGSSTAWYWDRVRVIDRNTGLAYGVDLKEENVSQSASKIHDVFPKMNALEVLIRVGGGAFDYNRDCAKKIYVKITGTYKSMGFFWVAENDGPCQQPIDLNSKEPWTAKMVNDKSHNTYRMDRPFAYPYAVAHALIPIDRSSPYFWLGQPTHVEITNYGDDYVTIHGATVIDYIKPIPKHGMYLLSTNSIDPIADAELLGRNRAYSTDKMATIGLVKKDDNGAETRNMVYSAQLLPVGNPLQKDTDAL